MSQTPPEDTSEMATYRAILQDIRDHNAGKLERGEMHKKIREKLQKALKAAKSKQTDNPDSPKE